MHAIVIAEFMDDEAVARLSGRHSCHYDPGLADRQDELPALVSGARALIVRNRTRVNAALLDAAPRLQCVGRLGVGLDNIDLDACRARGIAVYPATGANDQAVAEHVLAMALVLLRGAYGASDAVAAGAWPRERLIGREIAGKTIGLIGLGSIARQVARRAAALGMTPIACDPLLGHDDPAWKLAARREFEPLLAEADIVSLHVPLTPSTRRMIDAERLAQMKPGAVLINAARGGIVDEDALCASLRSGHLSGAALDVFENEPLTAAAGARFAGIANLILTPHIAGVSVEANVRVSNMIADIVLRHLEQGE